MKKKERSFKIRASLSTRSNSNNSGKMRMPAARRRAGGCGMRLRVKAPVVAATPKLGLKSLRGQEPNKGKCAQTRANVNGLVIMRLFPTKSSCARIITFNHVASCVFRQLALV